MRMKVLVTGAGALLGQGIIRSLQRSNLDVEIIAADPSPLSAALYWADRAYLVPFANAPDYLDRVRELLRWERPDAVLVGTDVELPIFAERRFELEREFGTHILVSDPEVIRIADDKYATFQFLQQSGFDHPATCLPGQEAALVERVGFPLVVKPRVGARSVGVSVVNNRDELERALGASDGLLVQECVGSPAHEYTASALVFEGECRATIVMRRDLRDGNTYRAFAADYPALNAAVRRLGTALRPYGPANFQFRLGRDDEVTVFEINARFSGTTPLRALVGFNEVEMCLRHILGAEPVVQPAVEEKVILRHWSETVVRASDMALIG